ncbi:MAG: pseudouridine synthase [Anaerolineae bacterium]
MMPEERLQKVLARAGVGSRRKAEGIIAAGRVAVNGEIVLRQGVKVDLGRDLIAVDGQPVALEYLEDWIVNKPPGFITTVDDPWGRPTARQLVPTRVRVFPVGRLDADSTGLLLFTNDGDLAHKLMHPSFEHEKAYRVLVDRKPDAGALRRLRRGIDLEGRRTAPAEARVEAVAADGTWLCIVLREGRKRQIRRMLDAVGHPVRGLVRVRIGPLVLGDLPEGQARRLTPEERTRLRRYARR